MEAVIDVNSTVLEGIVVARDKSRPGKLVANLPQTCPEPSVRHPTLLMSHQTRLNFIENYGQLTHSAYSSLDARIMEIAKSGINKQMPGSGGSIQGGPTKFGSLNGGFIRPLLGAQ